MMKQVFVYGTLRRKSPHRMARTLENQGRFLGEGHVQGRLYNLGRYPGLIRSTNAVDQVVGDLYELIQPEETLRELDQYEGCQYARQPAQVSLADGRTTEAWVYWYLGKVEESQRIEGGDYFG